ncbi:MAG: M20/M25/M40 family metallo-hydrolase [Ignavibacteriales bacterium]|nr:M20/M25/M40 family metallo-hydrolase [Ignavibacteriales bacterium]
MKSSPAVLPTRLLTILVLSLPLNVAAQSIRAYRQANEHKILQELVSLLTIPNVAADRANIQRNADKIMEMLRQRGVETRLLEHVRPEVPPVVFGELKSPGAKETIMFYCHYDGQPTDSSKWTDTKPWEPVLRTNAIEAGGTIIPFPGSSEKISGEWRVYARSSSDDKSPIVVLCTALDAHRANKVPLTANLKFFFEGEEEAGSPHLADILRRYKDLLKADIWITADGPVHQNGQKLVFFGCRGIVSAEITVYGSNRALHSGHYGNWAPNPAMWLSKLIASMKDETGKVLIPGFYDDVEPLRQTENEALAESPDYDRTLMKELGFAQSEGGGKSLNELINLPSLNVSGLSSGYVGSQSRTLVPATATARIDMRLVKGNDPQRQVERLKEHIRKQGYIIVSTDPDRETRVKYPLIAKMTTSDGYKAYRTPMNLPIAQKIVGAVQSVSSEKIVRMPTLGGSGPLSLFAEFNDAPQIGVPIVNYDNNQHSENENVRIQNLWDGIEIYAAIMAMK